MLNSKQSDDFITWLNIDGVTKWTEPALKTKLKELFDNAINQAVDESLSDMEVKMKGWHGHGDEMVRDYRNKLSIIKDTNEC